MREIEKQTETALFILYQRIARVFYDVMNEVQNSTTVCFDMMKSLVLQKTSISQAYYSRQLYLYVFGVIVHRGKERPQLNDDIHLYVWQENQNKKENNMISSALEDCFRRRIHDLVKESGHLCLFSDSCFGQNKNMNLVSMLMSLKQLFSGLTVNYTFPIRGHSYLPADRVFGRIEQSVRKQETILLPEEYYSILKKFGHVYVYGKDWVAFVYKSAAKRCVKQKRSFKIGEARMLDLSSSKVGYKTAYSGEFCYHSVLKPRKKWTDLNPTELPETSTAKEPKKKDVFALLRQLGVNDEVQAFYNNAFGELTEEAAKSCDE